VGLRRAALAAAVALLASGCVVRDFRSEQARVDHGSLIWGRVARESAAPSPIVVVLLRAGASEDELVDHFLLDGPGRWSFAVAPGRYRVVAWADLNGDGVYDDEPALDPAGAPVRELRAGDRLGPIELSIPDDARAHTAGPVDVLAAVRARSEHEQERISMAQSLVAGRVVPLDDERFGREAAQLGLRRRIQFLENGWCGIYFLRPYDPQEIPVLFVHGMTGSAAEFDALAEALPSDFQPWFFHYPSGSNIEEVARTLGQLVTQLRQQHGFDAFVLVAHSMGGLVSRQFLLGPDAPASRDAVTQFVSISTPWGGMASAEQLAHSPEAAVQALAPPPALLQIASGGEFIASLFYEDPAKRSVRRRLPEALDYQVLFSLNDAVVPVSSALRVEVQEEAGWRARALPYGHADILRSPEAASALNQILESHHDEPGKAQDSR
jgi:pimeloyl-ACP methyl ester carboxylesterase